MKYVRRKVQEDAPANGVGGGNIAGLGVGAKGEPGILPKSQSNYRKKNKAESGRRSAILGMWRRGTPANQLKEETKMGKFAGHDTFIVPSNTFHKARLEKRKGKHWKTYIGEDDHGKAIREYDRKHKGKKPIILQDETTGAMCYARYGKK